MLYHYIIYILFICYYIKSNGSQNNAQISNLRQLIAPLSPTQYDAMYYSIGTVCDLRVAYYQLDPENNLPVTQQKLLPFFKQILKLKGEFGKKIPQESLYKIITMCQLYLYCGHNNGIQYYSLNNILSHTGIFTPVHINVYKSSTSRQNSGNNNCDNDLEQEKLLLTAPPEITTIMWLFGCSSVKLHPSLMPHKAFTTPSSNASSGASQTMNKG